MKIFLGLLFTGLLSSSVMAVQPEADVRQVSNQKFGNSLNLLCIANPFQGGLLIFCLGTECGVLSSEARWDKHGEHYEAAAPPSSRG
jgi:hypothetical protein